MKKKKYSMDRLLIGLTFMMALLVLLAYTIVETIFLNDITLIILGSFTIMIMLFNMRIFSKWVD